MAEDAKAEEAPAGEVLAQRSPSEVLAASQPQSVNIFLLARLGFALAFAALTLLVAAPFASSLTWALVLAVLFLRPHRALEALVGPNFGATLSVLIVAFIVVAPTWFVSDRLISEAISAIGYIQGEIQQGKWRSFVDAHPWLQTLNNWIGERFQLQETLARLGAFLTNVGASFIRQSTGQLVTILLAFYMLFFFLRDRSAGVEMLMRLSPFSRLETDMILVRIRDTINAIVYGTLAVAALQGALGGLMFWWLDFSSPMLWTLIMGLLSIVPVLGTFVVWIPATIYLAVEGRWGDALTLGLWGGVVIASADNLLRPLLVGDSLRLHTASIFVAMLGGLQLFGPSGVFLGPIVMTTTTLMFEFLRRRANPEV